MDEIKKIEALFNEGLEHYRSGEFFEAHESWEELWSDFYLEDRRFVQGLIQLSVSLKKSLGFQNMCQSAIGMEHKLIHGQWVIFDFQCFLRTLT